MEIMAPNVTLDAKTQKASAEKNANPAQEKKLKKACADFEAMLAYQLLKSMRQTIPKNGSLGRSSGKDTYEMLMDQKIAEDLTKKGEGMGVQKILYKQVVKHYLKKD